ncbi:MAG: DNA repair protein RecO [Actinobacteria bacterium]|nr:DNA repair protein RecO [Actinomycetota bacterium]
MSLFSDRGVVLRTYKLGEADRIVVILTEGHGKIRAVAKGVRRTTSKFGARLEPLSHVSLLVWSGRSDLDIINQAEIVDTFRTIREDLDRVPKGISLLEVADQISQEGLADPRLYQMLVGALRALSDTAWNPELVAPAFFLKVLGLEGSAPVLDACASCGARPSSSIGRDSDRHIAAERTPERATEDEAGDLVELVAFDLVVGGMLCQGCRRGRAVSAEALDLMRRILNGSLSGVLRGVQPGSEEVTQIATEAMETHLDRRLRSVRSAVGA